MKYGKKKRLNSKIAKASVKNKANRVSRLAKRLGEENSMIKNMSITSYKKGGITAGCRHPREGGARGKTFKF